MPKQRNYNPNASYAERMFNRITDKLGITTAPTYKDGYGVERNPEEARTIGERKRLTKAVEHAGEALTVGGLGAGLLTNPITTVGTLLIGAAAGEGVNYVTRKATNGKYQTFGELIDPNEKVSNYFGSRKIGDFITEGANPGYLIGGYGGAKASFLLKNPKGTIAAIILNRNISKSKSPTVRPVYHATTYLGDDFNVVTKGGELGIHVGTDRSAPNYFLTNWSKLRRTGNPVIRTGYLTEYNGRIIDTPDLIGWNPKTIYKEALDKTSELRKRISAKELKGDHDSYTTAMERPETLENMSGNSVLEKQTAAYTQSGKATLNKLTGHNIDGFRYRNNVENAGNISIAIFNPNRINWSKEIFTAVPKPQINSSADFSLLSKFGDPNLPNKFYRKGGKLWKK